MGELVQIILSVIILAAACYHVRQWLIAAEQRGYTRGYRDALKPQEGRTDA